jgi:hypothetical protein
MATNLDPDALAQWLESGLNAANGAYWRLHTGGTGGCAAPGGGGGGGGAGSPNTPDQVASVEPNGPMGPVGDFAMMTVRAAGLEPLAAALSALRQVAEALGVFQYTWTAHSIAEVGDMLVAEVARRDTAAGTAAPPAGWQPTTGQLDTLATVAADAPGRVDLAAIAAWAGLDRHEGLVTQGRTDTEAVAGYPATTHHPGGSAVVGIAMHDAPPGGQVTILLGNGPVPSPGQPPRDAMGSRTWSGTEDRRRAGLAPKTSVYEELVAAWRREADADQVKAGDLPPSQVAEVARRRGAATAGYRHANQLADILEPLRTGEDT